MRRTLLLTALALSLPVLLLGCNGRRGGGGAGEGGEGALASGIVIERITILQGVEVELMDNDDSGDRNAPVVAGRDALVRIYVDTLDEFSDRDLRGVVKLVDDDGDTVGSYDHSREIQGDSIADDLNRTINVEIPGEDIQPGVEFVVSVHETEDGTFSGWDGNSQWPLEGTEDLEVEGVDGPLRITFVPIRYDADGTGRLPETGDGQIEIYEEWLTRLYPTADLEFTVAEPVGWNYTVSAFGQGWDDLLNGLIGWRDQVGFEHDEYVYGAFMPASSFAGYCSEGCVAGLSVRVDNPSDAWGRVSIGLGFPGEDAAMTMAHEIGHAHGRSHAPCGVNDPDPSYPHDDAHLGVHGYDIVDEDLVDKNDYFDVMSYCDPGWVSDYTFEALFERAQAITGSMLMLGDPSPWSVALVGADGALRSGGYTLDLLPAPGGEPRPVELLDQHGQVSDVVEARFLPYTHIDGGLLLYPKPGDDVSSLRLDGRLLSLE
jgi:hypothetical protein